MEDILEDLRKTKEDIKYLCEMVNTFAIKLKLTDKKEGKVRFDDFSENVDRVISKLKSKQ
jgi:hypothetical protein